MLSNILFIIGMQAREGMFCSGTGWGGAGQGGMYGVCVCMWCLWCLCVVRACVRAYVRA